MEDLLSVLHPHCPIKVDALCRNRRRVEHPIGQRLGFAHVRIERVRSAFTNDRDDDRGNSRGITWCCSSDIHGPRLEIRGLCPQWVKSGSDRKYASSPLLPRKRTFRWDTALNSCDTSWDSSRALDPVSH